MYICIYKNQKSSFNFFLFQEFMSRKITKIVVAFIATINTFIFPFFFLYANISFLFLQVLHNYGKGLRSMALGSRATCHFGASLVVEESERLGLCVLTWPQAALDGCQGFLFAENSKLVGWCSLGFEFGLGSIRVMKWI